MSTEAQTIDYLLDQLSALGGVSARKMFGEYALYFDQKVVALVCDDQLYLKPTKPGLELLGTVDEQPAYPGAKPSYLISADQWEDQEGLCALILATAKALPNPKPKTPKPKTPKPKASRLKKA